MQQYQHIIGITEGIVFIIFGIIFILPPRQGHYPLLRMPAGFSLLICGIAITLAHISKELAQIFAISLLGIIFLAILIGIIGYINFWVKHREK